MVKRQQAVEYLAAVGVECVHGFLYGRVWRVACLHLGLEVVPIVRPHHEEILPPFIHCYLSLGLDHCVDTPH